MTRLDRMKHGSGIKDRDDRSSGIEIRIADALAKINPTDPLILGKKTARRNLNCSDSSGISLANVLRAPQTTFFFPPFFFFQRMDENEDREACGRCAVSYHLHSYCLEPPLLIFCPAGGQCYCSNAWAA